MKKILLVSGHLRNYYYDPRIFIEAHLSKFSVDSRFLYTHRDTGWWTGDMDKTLKEDSEQVDLTKVNFANFFDFCSFIDLNSKTALLNEYSVLPVNPERAYYREPSCKLQVVHRYLLMKQALAEGKIGLDDVVILTRPDIIPKDPTMLLTILKSIDDFVGTDKELLLFDYGGIPHDCLIVGKGSSLLRLFSPEVYNTNKYAQSHENLDRIANELFNTMRVKLNNSYYYANSPNMRQY